MYLGRKLASSSIGILVAVGLTACGLQGSGVSMEEKRSVGSFKALQAAGTGMVVLTVDPAASSDIQLTLTGDDNIVPELETWVDGDTLIIQPKHGQDFQTAVPLRLTATLPALERISAAGSIDVTVTGLNNTSFDVEARETSDITLQGTASRVSITSSDSADLRARGLTATEVTLQSSDSSDLEVCAKSSLTGRASGSSDVRYFCSPTNVQLEVTEAADASPGQ